MAKKTAPLLPATEVLLHQFGDRLRLARLRRRLPAKQVAERAGMAPMTLRGLERGGPGVTMGAYLAVMQVLGIEKDLDLLGQADPVGRRLQDAQLPAYTRAQRPGAPPPSRWPTTAGLPAPAAGAALQPGHAAPPARRHAASDRPDAPRKKTGQRLQPSDDARDWIDESGFASADALAALIDPLPSLKKRRR